MLWKRQQHQHIADHRRVEQVLADTAVELLAQDNGAAGGNHWQPPGGVGRQCRRQQDGSDQGAAIIQGGSDRPVLQFQQ
ncbi:hypothetical protein D3C77_722350 [compost metagenome]